MHDVKMLQHHDADSGIRPSVGVEAITDLSHFSAWCPAEHTCPSPARKVAVTIGGGSLRHSLSPSCRSKSSNFLHPRFFRPFHTNPRPRTPYYGGRYFHPPLAVTGRRYLTTKYDYSYRTSRQSRAKMRIEPAHLRPIGDSSHRPHKHARSNLSTFVLPFVPPCLRASAWHELSTIAPNLRISSPDIDLTHVPQSTWRYGGPLPENLRICHLSTPTRCNQPPSAFSFSRPWIVTRLRPCVRLLYRHF